MLGSTPPRGIQKAKYVSSTVNLATHLPGRKYGATVVAQWAAVGPVAAHFREGGILTRTLSRLKFIVHTAVIQSAFNFRTKKCALLSPWQLRFELGSPLRLLDDSGCQDGDRRSRARRCPPLASRLTEAERRIWMPHMSICPTQHNRICSLAKGMTNYCDLRYLRVGRKQAVPRHLDNSIDMFQTEASHLVSESLDTRYVDTDKLTRVTPKQVVD